MFCNRLIEYFKKSNIIQTLIKIKKKIMAGLGGPEIILIVVVVLLMFGGKKLPELMRGLGRGMKEFKDAKDGVSQETEKQATSVK
jgi:sec-independent protein translocase protein TatA